jgi:NAD(P)-dependent dehydrogenase (short-subunit alcohol dehydrogenase family)
MSKKHKTALITASTKGIGKAIALHLANDGYHITLNYHRDKESAEAAYKEIKSIGGKVELLKFNVSSEIEAQQLVARSFGAMDGIGVLVNNLGEYLKKPMLETTSREWQQIINSNLMSALHTTTAVIPLMRSRKYGRIINIGYASIEKLEAQPLKTPYVIAKTGLLIYTKSLAVELIKDDITVNMISPGIIENSLSQPIAEIPAGRVGSFDDINRVVDLFIQSPYMSGQNIEVAGGWKL